MSQWAGVVLAAGMGVRMKSRLPKVLHPVCGKEMVRYPVDLLQGLGVERILVVVSPTNRVEVEKALGDKVEYVEQATANGTGDAVLQTANRLMANRLNGAEDDNPEHLIILGADSPLLEAESLSRLMSTHLEETSNMTILTGDFDTPGDLGRVQRNGTGQVIGIVEAATGEGLEDSPAEINGGAYCFSAPWLWEHLPQVEASPVGEVYLTALASMNSEGNASINAVKIARANDLQGVNNRVQLAQVEAELRQRINQRWMLDGVTIFDPASVFIDAEVTIGQDAVILPNTMLLGRTTVGEESEIGPGSVLRDSSVGNRCRVTTSVLEDAVMEDGANIGPFSHLRSGAYLESGVHIGNFAEIKESRLAVGSLMGHFGYIGDASIGANVNLGAGMVTCNYDGREKHRTNIGAGVFIGCDTMLVAPVTVGDDAVTGAGSVITEDVPQGRLAVGVPARIVVRKSDNT